MKKEEIEKLVNLRQELVQKYGRLRDYKQNVNAIMKERDYAETLFYSIKKLDDVLKEHVNFSDKN